MTTHDTMPSGGYRPGSPRQRAASALLSAAILLVALLLVLRETGYVSAFGDGHRLTAFDIPARSAAKAAAKTDQHRAVSATARTRMPRPKIVIPHPSQTEPATPGFIHMSHDDFMAGDIARARGPALAQGGEGGAGADTSDRSVGTGPGGVRLYNADWYREPTDAQLATYQPKYTPGPGWGEVACRTIDHYHVDDCQILGESPSGSGYGRAVLDAAWQFLVIPPRINSRMQVGEWVRIRITYTPQGSRAG